MVLAYLIIRDFIRLEVYKKANQETEVTFLRKQRDNPGNDHRQRAPRRNPAQGREKGQKDTLMVTHKGMVEYQASRHALNSPGNFKTREEYILYLIGQSAYVRAARLSVGKRVLDLGCNTGYGTAILSGQAAMATGADVSAKALRLARKRYPDRSIDFRQIDGEKLPFEDGSFDLIVSFQVIEHVVDYEKYLGEIKRVLSQSGTVLFTTPNASTRLEPGMPPWNEFHVREFNGEELAALLGGFFSNVSVWGLSAQAELYAIEMERYRRARELARKLRQPGLRSLIARISPGFVLQISQKVRNMLGTDASRLDEGFEAKYSLDDLFYSQENLARCLDLLAICSQDRRSLVEAQEQFVEPPRR